MVIILLLSIVTDYISRPRFNRGDPTYNITVSYYVLHIILLTLLFRALEYNKRLLNGWITAMLISLLVIITGFNLLNIDNNITLKYIRYFYNLFLLIASLLYIYDFTFNTDIDSSSILYSGFFIVCCYFIYTSITTYISLGNVMNVDFARKEFHNVRQTAYLIFNVGIASTFLWQLKHKSYE